MLHYFHNMQQVSLASPNKILLDKEGMITIWCLGNMESFRSVAQRFNISTSTCWGILYRTCQLLLDANNYYKIIHWPSAEEQRNIAEHFSRTYNFRGIVGCIDGYHMRIVAPTTNRNSYINRKGYHSVLLQGVCDPQLKFTDVYTGEVGSIHDFNMFKRSPPYDGIRDAHIRFFNDTHLLGDLAYKLNKNLMVPFKNYRNLTPGEVNYNNVVSKLRAKIEHAFALLKGRFCRLKYLETVRLDLVALIITASCILHNICILKNDILEDMHEEQEIQDNVDRVDFENETQIIKP